MAATGVAALGAVTIKFGKDSLDTFKTCCRTGRRHLQTCPGQAPKGVRSSRRVQGVWGGRRDRGECHGETRQGGRHERGALLKLRHRRRQERRRFHRPERHPAERGVGLPGDRDPAQRAAIASAAFGKSWTDMVDVLDKSRSKIAELRTCRPGSARTTSAGSRTTSRQPAGLATVGRHQSFHRPAGHQAAHRRYRRATGVVRWSSALSRATSVRRGMCSPARRSEAQVRVRSDGRRICGAGWWRRRCRRRSPWTSSREPGGAGVGACRQRRPAFSGLFDTQTTAISAGAVQGCHLESGGVPAAGRRAGIRSTRTPRTTWPRRSGTRPVLRPMGRGGSLTPNESRPSRSSMRRNGSLTPVNGPLVRPWTLPTGWLTPSGRCVTPGLPGRGEPRWSSAAGSKRRSSSKAGET